MLDVCLLGTGGMMPIPGRWLTSCMMRCNGSSLLIDCGEGTQIAIREKGWSFHPIDVICITHFHGDHISGLTGLLLSMGNADRTEPVTIIGPKNVERVVNSLRIIAPELPFELKFLEIEGPEADFVINDYHIHAFLAAHRVTCYGYSVTIERAGKFDAAKAQENQVPLKLWSRLQKGAIIEEDGRVFTPELVLGPARKGLKVTYCTDSRPTPMISKNAAGADLFICEGMYGENDKIGKAVEHKHMVFSEAAKLAAQADPQPREMWLTHFSPALTRPKEFLPVAREIFPNTKTGKSGMTVTLKFEDEEE